MNNQPSREETVFHAALEIQDPEGRAEHLRQACEGDEPLRQRVEALLRAAAAGAAFLEPATVAASAAPTVRLTVPISEKPGDRISHYKLLERLGEGGCGVVYMADQTEPIRRRVALKVVKLGMDTKEVIARFEAERQALALMDHPNIAKVFDAGATETGRPYFVMELVRGIRITDYCDQNNLSTRERLDLFIQVCHAVQHAHQKGIIHRDLKPSNILVTSADGVPVPKVIDFGIAKATTQQQLTDKTVFTAFQQFIGTPAYMSPEQAEMSALDIDTRSDIYSLGVLLYELLTGRPPFEQQELLKAGFDEMRRLIREQEPAKPSTCLSTLAAADLTSVAKHRHAEPPKLVSLVRGDLDWIVMKCLEKDRTRRYRTADALADDLHRHLTDHPVEARSPTVAYRLRRFVRRNRMLVGGGAAIAGILVVATALSLYLAYLADQARHTASQQRDKARQAEAAEMEQRKVAEASVMESRQRLVRLDVASGVRALDEGDAFGSLLWFAEALRQEPTNSPGTGRHRLRLGTTLSQLPPLTQMWFHEQPVSSVCFSADGRWAVTAGGDGARVWETATGLPVGAPLPHAWAYYFVAPALSADGRRLLTVSDHRAVRLWDTATGRPISAPMEHRFPIRCAVLSPDGRHVFTACYVPWDEYSQNAAAECEIHIWDADTGRPTRRPLKWCDSVQQLVLSPSGDKLAVRGNRGFAAVWDLGSSQALQFNERPVGEARVVPALAPPASQTNASFASRLPDIPEDNRNRWLPEGSPEARRSAFDAEGQRIVFACADGTAQVWSLASGKRTMVLGQPAGPGAQPAVSLRRVEFSPDGMRVLTVASDGTVSFWDPASGRAFGQLRQPTSRPDRAGFSPDGRWVVTVGTEGRFGEARVWDVATGEPLSPALVHDGEVVAVFTPDGAGLLTAGTDRAVRLWSLTGARPAIGPLQHPWERVKSGGIATGRHEPTRLQESGLEDDSAVTWAAFSADGRRVATVSYNGSARVWDAATGAAITPFARMSHPLEFAAFSPDGSRFATIGGRFFVKDGEGRYPRYASDPLGARETGLACVWDARSGQPVTPVMPLDEVPRWAEFSPDGRWLIARSGQTAGVWDAQTGQPIALAMQPTMPLRAIAFSHDGRRLVACFEGVSNGFTNAARPETRIYEVLTSQPITPPLPEVGEVAAFEFSADGHWLVTVESDSNPGGLKHRAGYAATVRIWDAATGRAASPPLRAEGEPRLWPRRPSDFFPKTVFSPDSARLTLLVTDGVALVWDIASGRAVDPVRLPDHRAVIKAFSRDGTRLVSLRGERTLQVWDAVTGEPLTPAMETAIYVDTIHFSPDGNRLLAVGADGAELWPLAVENRSAEAVMLHAQLLSGRQFDASGSITPAAPETLTNLWPAIRIQPSARSEVSRAQVRAWHERSVEICELQKQWFAAGFHLNQLLLDRPDDDTLRRHRNRVRGKAELEHLKDLR